MTCKECLHDGVCYMQEVCNDIDEQLREFGCDDFKNKSDFVEVVRCGQCEYWYPDECPVVGAGECHKCDADESLWNENDFCSYGTPKERGGRSDKF